MWGIRAKRTTFWFSWDYLPVWGVAMCVLLGALDAGYAQSGSLMRQTRLPGYAPRAGSNLLNAQQGESAEQVNDPNGGVTIIWGTTSNRDGVTSEAMTGDNRRSTGTLGTYSGLGKNSRSSRFGDPRQGLGLKPIFGNTQQTRLGRLRQFSDLRNSGLGGKRQFPDLRNSSLGGFRQFGNLKSGLATGTFQFGDPKAGLGLGTPSSLSGAGLKPLRQTHQFNDLKSTMGMNSMLSKSKRPSGDDSMRPLSFSASSSSGSSLSNY